MRSSHRRSAIHPIRIIAHATLREAIRNRILWITLAFAIALVFFSMVLASISLNERNRLILDISLFAASGIGSIIAMVLAITSFAHDLQRHTAYMVLSRPVSRRSFIVGKYLGVLATMAIMLTIMMLSTVFTLWIYGSHIPVSLGAALWLTLLENAVVIGVAMAFSSFAVPVLAATYTMGVVIAGHLAHDIQELAQHLLSRASTASQVLKGFFYAIPDLQAFSLRQQLANNLPIASQHIGYATLYGIAYAALMLCVSSAIFTHKKSM